MKLSPQQVKQPDERINFTLDFTNRLDEHDFIAQVDALAVSPTGLNAATEVFAGGTAVRVWVEGGENGVTYKVTVRVRTMAVPPVSMSGVGELIECEIPVKVKEI